MVISTIVYSIIIFIVRNIFICSKIKSAVQHSRILVCKYPVSTLRLYPQLRNHYIFLGTYLIYYSVLMF